MSHSSSSSSSFEIRDPVCHASSDPCSLAKELIVGMSRPSGSNTPADTSETATTVAPRSTSSWAAIPPTLPNPCTTHRCSVSFHPSRSHARATTITTPAPVASCRKTLPPIAIGFPVTISGTAWPRCIEYVSIIQAMVWSFVAMSGAGMSSCGPMNGSSSDVKRRVSRSSSPWLIARGLQRTPPFAPPYGKRSRAHFHVIHTASAAHSPSVTSGSKRTPPFVGPRTLECCTR